MTTHITLQYVRHCWPMLYSICVSERQLVLVMLPRCLTACFYIECATKGGHYMLHRPGWYISISNLCNEIIISIFERDWCVGDKHTKASKKRRQLWTRSTSPAELDSEHICTINEDRAPSSRRWLLHCTTFTRYEMVSLRCFGLAEPSFSQESSKYPISFYKKKKKKK